MKSGRIQIRAWQSELWTGIWIAVWSTPVGVGVRSEDRIVTCQKQEPAKDEVSDRQDGQARGGDAEDGATLGPTMASG